MMKTNLNNECKNLELIIEDLATGKETCDISDDQYSVDDVLEYLRGYLQELEDLNRQITKHGNTSELLKKVHDKYSELWLFQLRFTVDSLPRGIGGLLRYPKDEEMEDL